MFQDMTYENILQRMLDNVPQQIDKREGSIIYDALAPAAAEICQMYIEIETLLNETFADTAHREYLVKRASERGLYPYKATNPILKASFNVDVQIGERFYYGDLFYCVTEKLDDGYKVICETTGESGNKYFGKIIPVNEIPNLTSAQITELLIPGTEEEDTEIFRQRFFDSLSSQAFGGNVEDYKLKVSAIEGCGGVKVIPCFNGGGTVKVVITDSQYKKASDELISLVKNTIDPEENTGLGMGLAPIGHCVTVESAQEQKIDITAEITYESDWNWEEIKQYVFDILDDYITELNSNWAESSNIIVRTSQIESRILDLEGVLDISHTFINGEEENFIVDEHSIVVRGDFNGQNS